MSNVTIDLTNPEEKAQFEREERLKVLKQQAEKARLQADAVAKELEELEATGEERFQVEQAFKALKLADESNNAAKKDEAYQALYVTLQALYSAENKFNPEKEYTRTITDSNGIGEDITITYGNDEDDETTVEEKNMLMFGKENPTYEDINNGFSFLRR